MDLIISTFGTKIRRQHEQITVEVPSEKALRQYPARRISRILIMGNSSISSDAVRLAMKHGVDISYIGSFGKPEARIVPSVPTGSTKVRHAQFRVAFTGGAFSYARLFVIGKMKNQLMAAEALGRAPDAVSRMRESLACAECAMDATTLMSAEGRAAERYFSGAWAHVFNGAGRDQRGGDRVNAALNYGYGILYNEAERALLFAGLDPYVGLFHSERYGKPSLTLDFVEEFRVAVIDTSVLPLFERGRFTARDFVREDEKERLASYGRKKIVRHVFAQLNETVPWSGTDQCKLSDVMTYQAQSLARSLQERMPTYKSFIASSAFYEKSFGKRHSVVEDAQS